MPEIAAGADLAALVAGAVELSDGDVVVVAHKAVSKAEGRVRRLADVDPGPRARALGRRFDKDPRHVQVVLDEAAEVLRAERGVIITVTAHGFVCANAGVDASNAPEEDTVVLLPVDPDASARGMRAGLRERTGARLAVLITDSFGRAWRHGQTDVAIGAAGLAPLEDWRGRPDSVGREMRATWIALADEIAGAADLARGKDTREPVVVVRGLERHVSDDDGPGAAALVRERELDLFR
ncbi:MAG: F420-dependent oxidoreductase [Solirubrobacterales bacterium]|nr:F420-dependent oxidoreductase [Solirubrobacterales bacterium]